MKKISILLCLYSCLSVSIMNTSISRTQCLLQSIKAKVCDIDVELGNVAKQTTSVNILATSNIIEELVREIRVCAPTPILTAGDITIDSAGVFCLTRKITGIVTINAENVVLDLNGKEILGRIVIMSSFVTIINGLIDANATTIGIDIRGTMQAPIKNIIISDMTITNGTNGINALFANNLIIKDCNISNSSSTGIFTDNVSNSLIKDVQSNDNATGISITGGSSNITIHNCQFNDNTTGLVIDNSTSTVVEQCEALGVTTGFSITAASCLHIKDCTATITTQAGVGFSFPSSTDVLCSGCFACGTNNTIGFGINNSILCIEGCVAKNNIGTGVGFSISGASSFGVLKENIAVDNTTGFLDVNSNVKYVANYATNNSTNYSPGATFAPVAPGVAASYWRNITD